MKKQQDQSLMRRAACLGLAGGRKYQQGGRIEALAENEKAGETARVANQQYWMELLPEMGPLAARALKSYNFDVPSTGDKDRFMTDAYFRSGGRRQMGADRGILSALSGATDVPTAWKNGPGIFVNYAAHAASPNKNMFDEVVETKNHELGHIALAPINWKHYGDHGYLAPLLDEIVLRAVASQTSKNKDVQKDEREQLRTYLSRLTDEGRSRVSAHAKSAAKMIDEDIQGNPYYRNLPFRRVDTAVMQKEATRGYKRGGLASIVSGLTGGNEYGVGALVPFKNIPKPPKLNTSVRRGKLK